MAQKGLWDLDQTFGISKNTIEDAIQVINNGKQAAVDGYEGKRSIELNMAIYESSRTGKAVQL